MMVFGAIRITAWSAGKNAWFDRDYYDRRGDTFNDRVFLDLYFLAAVVAPLLIGGILVVWGLQQVL